MPLKILLLELICYVPIVIIAGNLFPPIGFIKIHWVYIGVIFLLSLLIIVTSNRAAGLLSLIFLLMVAQIVTAIRFSISDFIDFISGPIVFIAVVNVLTNENVKIDILRRAHKRMLILLGVPLTIALLQYMKILPLEFLNAKYVNETIYGEETIARVNGFLYHGIELAVIIFFLFTSIIILKSATKAYVILPLMIFVEFITVIKTGIISAILFAGFFSYFIDHRYRLLKSIIVALVVVLGFSYVFILIPDIQEQRFNFDPSHFRFDDQLFTGRGYIWNIYLQGVSHFNFFQILFGGGFGSAPVIFEKNSIGWIAWSAGTHNQLLELVVGGGLFSILLMYLIIKKQYQKLSKLFIDANSSIFNKYFVGILAIPLVTMGLTAPIMSMFIYWCGLCAAIIALKLKLTENTN